MAFQANVGWSLGRRPAARCHQPSVRSAIGWRMCSPGSEQSSSELWSPPAGLRPQKWEPVAEGEKRLPGATYDEMIPISNELILSIVRSEVPDQMVNDVIWFLLGYVNEEDGSWNLEGVPKGWRNLYPTPPDFVGVTRNYEPEVDKPVRTANIRLLRSIPMEHKQLLKEHVKFKGFKLKELTPNRTRRAQCANWISHYRMARYGL